MLKLTKQLKSPTIIVGFPGFGLVGTICTEFMLEHLAVQHVGKIWFEEMPAVIAVHKHKVIDPIGIFYNPKYNLLIIHAISGPQGLEWKIGAEIAQIAKKLTAKQVIILEGIGSQAEETHNMYYYTTHDPKKLQAAGLKPLEEGIIMGLAGTILLQCERPISALFAETHSELPDSKAAAGIIEAMDKLLDLKVDTKPLMELATKFEEKLKGMMARGKIAQDEMEKKQMSYVG
ncbi:MAG: PAC2 family protein [Nanoarchaeota archaeon]|nr:PAC2 family protein [Nanoarchaeota archaeon]